LHFNYGWFEEHLPLKKIQAAHRWHRMTPIFRKYHLCPGRLLDIGCGHGLFLSAARKATWTTLGIDYPSAATRHAHDELGLDIVESDFLAAMEEGKIRLFRNCLGIICGLKPIVAHHNRLAMSEISPDRPQGGAS